MATNLDPSAEEIARVLKHLGDTLSRFDSGFSSQAQSTINSLSDANKALDDLEKSSEGLQKTQDGLNKDAKLSRNMFGENSKALGNLKNKLQDGAAHLKNLSKQIEDAEEGIKKVAENAAPHERDAAKRRLNDARAAHDAATAAHDVLERRVQGIDKVAGALPGSIGAIAKSFASAAEQIIGVETALLSGGDAVTFASNVLKIGIDDAAAGLKNVGTVADGLGSILMSTPNPYAIAGGVIIKAAGGIATAFAEASQAVKAGISLLEQEINKTATAYHSMSSVGANFATGMEEMRAAAGEAVMPLADFSRIVTANAQIFADAGLGMSGATKKFAQLSKSMSELGLREKIFELGYNFEEFGGLTADVMANLNTSGQLRFKTDAEISNLTHEYAKNLRIITDFTGQDARKRADQARKDSLRAGVYDKIMEQAGQLGIEKLGQMGLVQQFDLIKPMLDELIATRGQGMANSAYNLLAENNPEIKNLLQTTYRDIMDPTKDAAEAVTRLMQNLSATGESLKKSQGALGDISAAGTLVGGKPAEVAALLTSFRQQLMPLPGREGLAAIQAGVEAPKDNLTVELAKLREEQARAIARGEAIATPALTGFAGILTTTTKTVDLFGEAIEKAMKALGGYKTPGTAPTPVSGPVTLSGGQTVTVNDGGLFPEFSKWLSEHGLRAMGSGKPKFASGGITDGVSIAGERGPEAVVPLPDGRTIPVNIQSIDSNYGGSSSSSNNTMSKVFQELSEFFRNQNTTMQTNTGTLENILAVLRDSYDTQDRMLANSY
jgi:hypothetical protein